MRHCMSLTVFACFFLSFSTWGVAKSTSQPTSRPSTLSTSKKPLADPSVRIQKRLRTLYAQLQHTKWRPRYNATLAIAALGKKKGWSVFGRSKTDVFKRLHQVMKHDRYFWVRAGAAKALGLLGSRGVKELLECIQREKQSEVQQAAIEAIAHIATLRRNAVFLEGHSERVLRTLRKKLSDPFIGFTAAKALEKITGNALPLVRKSIAVLKGKRSFIRGLVANQFGHMSPRARMQAIPLLLDASYHTTPEQRTFLAQALKSIGKEALPMLQKAKTHKNTNVRLVAQKALQLILQKQ